VWSCFLVIVLLVIINYLVNRKTGTWRKYLATPSGDNTFFKSAANQEALFMALLLFWTYLRALRPEIEGLEKFMDFGFVNSILRSDWLPAPDMWLSGAGVNYYYLGHFFTAFLTRLTFIDPAITYNLMMATLCALSFMLAYSVAEFLVSLYKKNNPECESNPKSDRAGIIAGIIAGLAVCFAGNLHALIFGVLFPQWNNGGAYWFPNATRYIGYNPDISNDKTIHEFPLYSFVVSDLHAHVINILFVLTVVGLVISLAVNLLENTKGMALLSHQGDKTSDHLTRPLTRSLIRPLTRFLTRKNRNGGQDDAPAPAINRHIDRFVQNFVGKGLLPFILITFLIGLFPAINFWDYPIYIVFTGAMLLYVNLRTYNYSLKSLLLTVGQIVVAAAGAYIITLPFQLSFESMGTKINWVGHRSMLYQLGILWGCQLFFAAALIYIMIKQYKQHNDSAITGVEDGPSLFRFIEKANPADAFVFIIFICAIGLIIIPELVYVADIYPSHPRANTMFKLGYQAFILFGLGRGYTFTRIKLLSKSSIKSKSLLITTGCFLLIAVLLYPFFAINQWYFKHAEGTFEGLDGTTYMLDHQTQYLGADGETYSLILQDDYSLIRYINENIKGSPVIAESSGGSYTLNGRISANTGLPNILNWYVHQQLWRNSDHAMLDDRLDDINALYGLGDPDQVREILEKYDVEYIVIGQIERLNYPWIDEAVLQSMGDVVFRSNDLYMIHVK
jgi:uncharacterized membrane protein